MDRRKKNILVLCAAMLIVGLCFYKVFFSANTEITGGQTYLHIPSTSDFSDVQVLLKPHLKNKKTFEWAALKKKYDHNIKPGRYLIKKGWSNNQLVNLLRSGKQTPVRLSFNNKDFIENLASKVSKQIEADSATLMRSMTDTSFLHKNGFDRKTALAMYIPNSYYLFWNTTAPQFRKRMLWEYRRFWNSGRMKKAKQLKLSPVDVTILASIVQKETYKVDERPRVAGLYLNRLKHRWKLQADPTILYGIKLRKGKDSVIKRVLFKDLIFDSPYNTYKYRGLPPGPIGMPDISSIDAVLNAEKHDYFYMCASVTKTGYHEFAKTNKQHLKNRRKYLRWLEKQGIHR